MVSTDDEIITAFADLHVGTFDAYGTEEGSCIRADDPSWTDYWLRIEAHLQGVGPMGVYPMVLEGDRWVVNWGCVDFDEGESDSLIHALNLQAVLRELGITGWVCRSRSKGFHVWVYAAEPTPAYTMRRALLAATQIAKAPTKEINPKQESLTAGQLGNYVRLEYPGHLGERFSSTRRVAIDDGNPIELETFVFSAYASRASIAELMVARDLYREPERQRPRKERTVFVGPNPNQLDGVSPLARHILVNGPYTEGGVRYDRSATLWKLANILREDGVDYSTALDVLYEADSRWGKHHERGTVQFLDKMVAKAYGA